ncbi:MAG: PKD domain-containing protein [Pseudomonadota bacterium]
MSTFNRYGLILPALPLFLAFSNAPAKNDAGNISSNLLPQISDLADDRSQYSHSSQPTTSGKTTVSDRIRLDVVLNSADSRTKAAIERAGGSVLNINPRALRATVEIGNREVIEAIAALDQVQYIYPDYGYARQAGSVTSRAPDALKTITLTGSPDNLDGTGQTVGILSDSFARTSDVRDGGTTPSACTAGTLENTLPQNSGDLPGQIDLRSDDASSGDCPADGGNIDEGAAMAELVYDVASGSSIAFHQAGPGIAGFASGIDDLCTPAASGGAGATVAVDDIIYFAQLMYQADPVSQAASNCHESGIPYLTAAGNGANLAFHEEFKDSDLSDNTDGGTFPSPTRSDAHEWSNGKNYLEINLDAGEEIVAVLQWNQPALSVPGNDTNGPQIDLDLQIHADETGTAGLINSMSSFGNQQANNPGAGADPVEIVTIGDPTSTTATTYYIVVDHWLGNRENIPQDSNTPLEFRLVFFPKDSADLNATNDLSPSADGPTMYGHSNHPNVMAVAAVPWWEAPAYGPALYGPTTDIDPESFTAKGGLLEWQFAEDGSFVKQALPQKPDFASVDGNNTTFFGQPLNNGIDGESDGDPNFFGTSAAAPNAAAVIALMLESRNDLTPDEVATALKSSAVATAASSDYVGEGLIQVDAILENTPVADAGADQSVDGGDTVNLSGAGSVANGTITSYSWEKVSGPGITLNQANSADASFTAPNSDVDFTFKLTVTSSNGNTHSDTSKVSVAEVSDEQDSGGDSTGDAGGTGDDSSNDSGGGGGGGGHFGPSALLLTLALLGWRRRTVQ